MLLDPASIQRFRNAIKDDKAVFIFIPSAILKEKLAKKSDPVLNSLPLGMAEHILSCPQGSGISTDADLVLKYLEGSVDEKNAYLLSLGEIRVIGVGDISIKSNPKNVGIILPQ
jgi:hypothetical protein